MPRMQSSGGEWLKDLFILALLVILIVLPIRVFIISPFVVEGESMHPTFENLDYLLIDELSYRFEAPARGDVIVFRYPAKPSIFYIKRIVGLPGETVSINHGIVSVADAAGRTTTLAVPYVITADAIYTHSVTLGNDQYFVMGDNRPNSSDSRVWGSLPRADIMGRALLRLVPLSHLGLFPGEARYALSAAPASP